MVRCWGIARPKVVTYDCSGLQQYYLSLSAVRSNLDKNVSNKVPLETVSWGPTLIGPVRAARLPEG